MSTSDVDRSRVKLDLSNASRWEYLTVPYLLERGGLDDERPAVVFEETQRTYGELRDRARRLANGLADLGIEPMERVAVLSSNRLEYIEIEGGIAAARAIMVPLNWRLRDAELGNLLRRSQARAVITEDRFMPTLSALRDADEIPDLSTIIVLDSDAGDVNYEELSASASPALPERVGTLADPHEIIFTSGTTGTPKGVVWSNGSLLFNAIQQVIDYRLGPDCATYAVIDLYYIGGRHDFTWSVLQAGGTVHIKRSSGFDAESVVRYVAEHGITHVLWVPTMLYDILEVPGLADMDTSRLRMIMCGGQPISASMTQVAQEAFPSTDFVQVYGLTEAGGSVTFVPAHALRTKPGSAGKPSMHVQIRLVDETGAEAEPGAEGEILVRAPSMTAGYWD
ncbi:MAG: long-chain fatty acid--CoA ligase, partial [Conexibacter sp.]|nr:long-chain fatty acid--CoA ligase [Conexibacter sp.]